MINKYNLVNVTSALRILSLLLVLMLAPLSGNNYIQATIHSQMSGNEVDPTKGSNVIINPGLDPMITLSSNSLVLSAAANSTGEVNVTSNITWTATIDPADTWLTLSPGSATGNGTLTFTAQANSSKVNSRTAYVLIHATGVADQTIVVTQSEEKPAVTFSSSVTTGSLSVNLQFLLGGTFYIDWGNGVQVAQTANTLGQTYSTTSYVKGDIVKVYGSGIINLKASSGNLTSIVVSESHDLVELHLDHNNLTTLDLSKNTNLTWLDCSYNDLISLDITQNTKLYNLSLGYNNLSVLDVSRNSNLAILSCISNKLTSLDVTNNPILNTLHCYLNKLTALDVSRNSLLKIIYCYSNNLTFNTIPRVKSTYTSYSYAPQANIPANVVSNKVDVSSQLSAVDVNGAQKMTVYKWYSKSNVVPLISGTDYSESNGVFTFLKNPSDSVYCTMSNAAFPLFTDGVILRTVNLKVVLLPPTVTTTSIANVDVNTATGNGTITTLGIPDPIQYGFVWSTTIHPTVELSSKTTQGAISAVGPFISNLSGLVPGTTYYARAYATNLAGTGYGAEISFTTKGLLPNVTTLTVDGIGTTVATAKCNITSLGVPDLTVYGIVWSTSSNPTVLLSTKTIQVSNIVTGPFAGSMTGLISGTLYHVRAYATNALGTAYGEDVTFTALSPVINAPTPITLTGFSTFVGTASTFQKFSVGGTLESDLIITAPSGYEVRESGTSNAFGPSISFSPISGVVTLKDIDVRISATASIGTVSGNITCTSTKAVPQNVSVTGTVLAIPLTIADPAVTPSKVYDGTTGATFVPGALSGIVPGDIVSLNMTTTTATYDTPSVGTGKTITVTYTLQGAQAYKYIAPANYTATNGVITGKPLSATAPIVTPGKVYDGTTTVLYTQGTPVGVLAADAADVTLTSTATYDNSSVGTGKTITVTYGLTGLKSGNYLIPSNFSMNTGIITGKQLTASNPTITLSKIYDGSTSVVYTQGLLSGVETADIANVTLTSTGAYDNANIGTGKIISVIYGLTGTSSGNYIVPVSYTTNSGEITGKTLTVNAPTITLSKEYDGTTNIVFTQGTLSGVNAVDVANVTLTSTASYDNATAGTGKTITVIYGLTGSASSNYVVPSNYVINTGIITGKPLTADVPVLTLSKEYDGTTSVVYVQGSLNGVLPADVAAVSLSSGASYDNPSVATGKTITVTYGLNGLKSVNYLVPASFISNAGIITGKALTASNPGLTLSKVYDSNTSVVFNQSTLTGVVPADLANVILTTSASYDNPNAGTGKSITVTYGLTGSLSGNYLIPAGFSVNTGSITAKQLTATDPLLTLSKIYDATTSVVYTQGTLVGVETSDIPNVHLSSTASYDNATIGTGKTITVVYGLNGSQSGNYLVPANYTINTGIITGKILTASNPVLTLSKLYDGNTSVVYSQGILSGVDASDVANVILTSTASYDNSTVGNGKTITVTYGLTGSASANYAIPVSYTVNTGVITAKSLTVADPTITLSKAYDGGTSVVFTQGLLSGYIPADAASVNLTSTASYDNATVGTGKTITVVYGLNGAQSGNYTVPSNFVVNTGIITAKSMILTDPAVTLSKVYDGTTSVTYTQGILSGVEAADVPNVVLTSTASYNNATVGTGKTITVTYSLTGSQSGNYTVPSNFVLNTGIITGKPLTATDPTLTLSKVYDGNTSVVYTQGLPVGVEPVDVANVTLTSVASYDNASVGTGKTITVTYGLTGSQSGNYLIPSNFISNAGIITGKIITATDPVITLSKEYDGNTSAIVSKGDLLGVDAGDDVTLTATASYDNATVGTGKTITVTYGLTGASAATYTVPSDFIVTTGEITGKPLTASLPDITLSKVYDSSTSLVFTQGNLSGVLPGDAANVTLTSTGSFDNATVGTGKTITITYGLTGNASVNYLIPSAYSIATGIITGKQLTATDPMLTLSKVYDGSVFVEMTQGTLLGVEPSDIANVHLTSAAVYDNASVGTGKTITVTYGLTGSEAGNYIVPANFTSNSGTITGKPTTATDPDITLSKIYDGTTTVMYTQGSLQDVDPADGANLILTSTATYDNASAGTGKTITVTYSLTGSAAAIYVAPASFIIHTGVITGKALTATDPVLTHSKIYDSTPSVEFVQGNLNGVLPADAADVQLTSAGFYDNVNVGTGKTITVTYALTGALSGNYLIPADFVDNTGEITAKTLTATNPVITLGKVYDGTTSVQYTQGNPVGVEPADAANVVMTSTASYDNTVVGNNKTITVVYSLTGSASGNYVVPSNFIVNTGIITGKQLAVSDPIIILNKVYDGSTSVDITPGTLSGVETGDIGNVTIVATATYDNVSVGTGKTITITYTLTGSAAGNYTAPAGYTITNGEITGKVVTASNPDLTTVKVYDGTTTAAVVPGSLTGVDAVDIPNVTLNATASYDNATIGTGKTITVKYTLTGSVANTYAVPADYIVHTGEITGKLLTASTPIFTSEKVYDGTTSLNVTPGVLFGVEAADADKVILNATAEFNNATVGTGKTITVTYSLSGPSAINYAVPASFTVTNGVITGKPLTVVSLKLTTGKVYDGTNSAIFSVGSLAGVENMDSENVILSGTATYDNANAGTNKIILVAFNITGSAANNYIVPSDYTITNGEITAKPLTINDPVVVTDKMYDGNTTAVITTTGSLIGVETMDVNAISVNAVANYNSMTVGNNKTISVVYTLSGAAMDNYSAPVDFIITGAKISDNVTLSSTITSTSGCEGSYLDLEYTILTGTPTQYKITFSASALAAGIQNIDYTNLPSMASTGVLPVTIPKGTKDGVYQGTLQMRNELGIETTLYSFQFTINVSSDFIIPKFDDVVLCDNSSNNFVAYQWYKNGIMIDGATKQFYNDLDGLIGSYSLKVTTTDGQTLYTCAKDLNIPLTQKISVYPSPLKVNQPCTVKMSGMTNAELEGAELSVYTMQGNLIYHSVKVEKLNSVYLPSVDGMYLGNVTTSKGKVFPFKIIVEK